MPTNHLETIKQVALCLETLIEKIDSLDFCPIIWEDSYFLLHELEAAEEQIDNLSEQLYSILSDESFCDDIQNKKVQRNGMMKIISISRHNWNKPNNIWIRF